MGEFHYSLNRRCFLAQTNSLDAISQPIAKWAFELPRKQKNTHKGLIRVQVHKRLKLESINVH